MEAKDIPLSQLLLDPNNYRLQELSEFAAFPDDRFHLEQVQKTTLQRLQKESLRELRNSILANGFLPIERIVVTPYAHAEGRYLVIEGNRRVAALKSIQDQKDGGILIPDRVAKTLEGVPCIVADNDGEFPYFKETLMGIRHVGGIRQWGGYQRAKLIADLRDKHQVEATDVSDRLGLSIQEVNRRYRAFKALQQMQENEDYGEYAAPALYPIFHEAIALPVVRNWLGWNQATATFDNPEELSVFYSWITPTPPSEDGVEEGPAKLQSYSDVRVLKDILPNDEAREYLLDPTKKLPGALSIASKDNMVKRWRNEVIEAKSALEKVGAIEVKNFGPDDLEAINALISVASTVIQIHKSLASV